MNKTSLLPEMRHQSRDHLLGQIEATADCLLLAMEAKANQYAVKLIHGELVRLICNSCGWQMVDHIKKMHPLDLVRLVFLFAERDAETYVQRIEAEYSGLAESTTGQQTPVVHHGE